MNASIERAMKRYLYLLREAGIDRFEALQQQALASLQQRLVRINDEAGVVARLPGDEVLQWLIEAARRGKTGVITLSDLPGTDDYPFWDIKATGHAPAADATEAEEAEAEAEEEADRGLAGDEDFPFWDDED